MTKETMTIHEALCELKLIGNKIDKSIKQTYVMVNKRNNKKIQGMSIEDYSNYIKANYQKVTDLIKRRNAIKKAVVLSNAVTTVVINNVKMTVAEAIEMNNTGIKYQEDLLKELDLQFRRADKTVIDNNIDLEIRADDFVTANYGNKDKDNSSDIEIARKNYIEAQTCEMIDPIKIKKEIETLRDSIDNFKIKVDSALSVSNAITTINIEY